MRAFRIHDSFTVLWFTQPTHRPQCACIRGIICLHLKLKALSKKDSNNNIRFFVFRFVDCDVA